MAPRYRRVRDAVLDDGARAVAMAAGGALAFAPVEYAITMWAYAGPIPLGAGLRLAALTATLSLWLWLLLAALLGGGMIAVRLVRAQFTSGRERGLFVASEPVAGVRPGVPQVWAAIVTALIVGLTIQRIAVQTIEKYKETQLIAVRIALFGIVLAAIAWPLWRFFTMAARVAATALAPLHIANPFGRWRAAGVVLPLVATGLLATTWTGFPDSHGALRYLENYLPIRLAIALVVIAFGAGLGARYHAQRRPKLLTRRAAGLAALGCWALMTVTLVWWGADVETKYVAVTASPALDDLIGVVRFANDLDGDGYGSLLGEGDCAPFDSSIHPGAIDIPDDGIDQNCDGHDFSMHALEMPKGPTLPVPPQFKRTDWDILFITIDTVRYDSTSFGGYKEGPKHRDTTPRLAEFVKRSTSFTFTNAPSAGTMASIPAIITSKYFHSGIALDEHVEPGMPPRLMPENTLLSEIMKRGGYHTGVIASHEYWNDWGMDQGVDEYDNSIGKTPDPFRVCADQVTDHALAYISRQQGKKWFLWAHYIDPHGRYVAHPDVIDYGSTEPDLYDAELRWTDQQVGRLFDELVRLPSNDHTIIVVTSDHGDSMAEHNVPLGTHGTALYRELQHVPMIFYIPNNAPHIINGAVSNLDIVPTIAELAGIDVHDLSFEGRSEVPAIFYGKEDRDRIVFAETNIPGKQRAAISEDWKLIYYLNNNVYELFDLKADPWEHVNLASKNLPAMTTMKSALDAWLERVVYARDPKFNQAFRQMADVAMTAAPHPAVETTNQLLDDGKLAILGIDSEGKLLAPGAKVDLHVYFAVKERTAKTYRFQLVVWPGTPGDPAPANALRSPSRETADGLFPTDKWRAGEFVRERFTVTLPADWHGDEVVVALISTDAQNQRAPVTGQAQANDPAAAVLGTLPLAAK